MIANGYEWTKWAFDGVGGAAALGLVGWGVRYLNRKSHDSSSSMSANTGVHGANAVAIGAGAKVSGAPIFVGSHNTVTITSEAATAENQNDTTVKNWALELVSTVIILSLIFGTIGGLIYFSEHHYGTASGTLATQPRTEVGVALGDTLPSSPYEYDSICISKGVSCVGEGGVKDKTLIIPFQHGDNWMRVGLLLSSYNGTEEFIHGARVVISTTNPNVGLDYADHRDGLFHNSVEFSSNIVETTPAEHKPQPYVFDIIFREGAESFPVTVDVWCDDIPHHSVTFNLQPKSR